LCGRDFLILLFGFGQSEMCSILRNLKLVGKVTGTTQVAFVVYLGVVSIYNDQSKEGAATNTLRVTGSMCPPKIVPPAPAFRFSPHLLISRYIEVFQELARVFRYQIYIFETNAQLHTGAMGSPVLQCTSPWSLESCRQHDPFKICQLLSDTARSRQGWNSQDPR